MMMDDKADLAEFICPYELPFLNKDVRKVIPDWIGGLIGLMFSFLANSNHFVRYV